MNALFSSSHSLVIISHLKSREQSVTPTSQSLSEFALDRTSTGSSINSSIRRSAPGGNVWPPVWRSVKESEGYNVVYKITCLLCKEDYIGSTTRFLHERIAEHVRAARNTSSYPHYALSSHYRMKHHGSTPQLEVHTLGQFFSELDTRIGEATLIEKEKPIINQKQESDLLYTLKFK